MKKQKFIEVEQCSLQNLFTSSILAVVLKIWWFNVNFIYIHISKFLIAKS